MKRISNPRSRTIRTLGLIAFGPVLLMVSVAAGALVEGEKWKPEGHRASQALAGTHYAARLALRGGSSASAAAQSAGRANPIDFNRDIAPIFQASCYACHSGEKAQGQLRLDSEAGVLKGGVSGKVMVPGDSRNSLLLKRLLGLTEAPRMPMGAEPLPSEKINLIRSWIDHGSFSSTSTASVPSTLEAATEKATQPGLAGGHTAATAEPRPLHVPSGTAVAGTAPAGSGLFATQIRPILAERCYHCHGEYVHQNDLRLDSLASIMKGGASGKIVIPGSSEKSALARRLLGLDKPQMPYGGPPLAKDQIELVRRWIDEGAPGPDSTQPVAAATHPLKHWAYMKPVRPEVPAIKNAPWCRNPIDNFVLARLEKDGLSPSPEAGKETLIRRIYLDLIGLPPTPQEVDAFLADKSPKAYEKVVDRLLANPHYGEKWARAWLDLARYADSQGYEKDDLRLNAWKYRDWVINALNQDMSFKEFTIEQIAGDMLPQPTTGQLIATGFHRNTMLNQEGGVDREEYRWYSLIDRVNTTAAVWLGSTLACAQCHNHKFDPFTQKDYYRFLAFFDNVDYKVLNLGQGEGWVQEPEIELPTAEQDKKAKGIRTEIAQLQTVLDSSTPELEAAQTKWEAEQKAATANWAVLRPDRYVSEGGASLKLLPDNSVLAAGRNPEADTYLLQARTNLTGITGLRLEVLNDPSLPHGGPGRDPDGNFFLSDVEAELSPADKSAPPKRLKWIDAAADEAQDGYEIKRVVKNDEPGNLRGWAIDDTPSTRPIERQAVLIPEKPFGFEHGTLLTIRLKHQMLHARRNLGRFRVSLTATGEPKRIVIVPARLRPILDVPAGQRTQEEKNRLAAVYRSVSPLLQPVRDRIKERQKNLHDLGIVTAMIIRERPGFERPSTDLHIRGAYLSKGDKVYADVPAILNRLPADQMPNRLGLANWLVSEDNPLTARVAVNHCWEELFGRGIVETEEDFGTQGERPTHPELLDWLATEFMRQGWSMKKIKRLIVTSATYRQSSRVTPELEERDPYNKLLARGPRFRLDAETVRDAALSAAGLLSGKIGGPSVFPYQPEGVWDRPYSDEKWMESKGEDRYRRGIYTFLRRTSPYPSLTTFDAPSREFCTVRRVRTNTPLQALTTLNDPAFFEAARALAKRIMQEGGSDLPQRATYGFRLCLSRHPTPAELARILAFYNQQLERYAKDPRTAAATAGGAGGRIASSAPAAAGSADVEAAAWTMVSNVLLNLDETITKE